MKTYLEFVEGNSAKFWEITVAGTQTETRFGKIGAKGQTSSKTHASAAKAKAFYNSQIAAKQKKGYQLADAAKEEQPPSKRAKTSSSSSSKAKSKSTKKTESKEPKLPLKAVLHLGSPKNTDAFGLAGTFCF